VYDYSAFVKLKREAEACAANPAARATRAREPEGLSLPVPMCGMFAAPVANRPNAACRLLADY
jgi:hypothetical protein